MRIYVASSWRNGEQPAVVGALRDAGHEVYDFKNPRPGDSGFHWSSIDPAWQDWTPEQYVEALNHPIARAGFNADMAAMQWAQAFVMVQPCGRSAHLETGWAVGHGKPVCILIREGEPELMVQMVDCLALSVEDVLRWAREDAPGTLAGW